MTSLTIKYVFGKFYLRYGSKFTSQYDKATLPAVHEEWLQQLKDMTIDDIAVGLRSWNEDWPPNIIEFKKACRPPSQPTMPCHQMYQSLPAPKRTDEDVARGKQWIEQMKEKLH